MLAEDIAHMAAAPLLRETRRVATAPVVDAFRDTVACIVAGRRSATTVQAARWADTAFPTGQEATRLHTDELVARRHAAFVDAVAAHVLEYDDAGLAGHPSAVLVPVIWAERTRTDAALIVEAYTKAYESWATIRSGLHQPLHSLGWHPTSVLGIVAGAVASAVMRGHDADMIRTAVGIAASMSAGIVANFGTGTKAVQVGLAAERALAAVDLAEAGITASPHALDGLGGLLSAVDQSETGPRAVAFGWSEAGSPAIVKEPPSVKKYPICFASHRVVDGVLDLRRANSLRADDVVEVEAEISAASAAVLEQGQAAPAGVPQFSLEFAVASALVHGHIGLPEVDPSSLDDPRVRDLMSRVVVLTTESRSSSEPSFAASDRVRVRTRSHGLFDSGEIEHARGSVEAPLLPGELDAKMQSCLEYGETDASARGRIVEQLEMALAGVGETEL